MARCITIHFLFTNYLIADAVCNLWIMGCHCLAAEVEHYWSANDVQLH